MKKLVILLVLLIFVNVNAQELQKKIKFTAIGSEHYFKRTNSVSISNSFISIADKKVTLSINMDFENTDSSVVLKKLPKVKSFNYYSIIENIIVTNPDWDLNNVDPFGFKLVYQMR